MRLQDSCGHKRRVVGSSCCCEYSVWLRLGLGRATFDARMRQGSRTMLGRLISLSRAIGIIFLLLLNTLVWVPLVYCSILAKLLVPDAHVKRQASGITARLARRWALINVHLCDALLPIKWDVRCIDVTLSPFGRYLISANHQSWNDIYALVRVFGRTTPFFKFLLKQQLIWVPILGLVWWGLDYPFMKRYSREQIARNPQLRGRDLEIVRQACTCDPSQSLAIVNFLEGTRFTTEKHRKQESPYRHLLRPKSGGLSFAMAAMKGELTAFLDVTIVYPDGAKSLWSLLSGCVRHVIVEVRTREVPKELSGGDYLNDIGFRQRFQEWVDSLWAEKDRRIDELRNPYMDTDIT